MGSRSVLPFTRRSHGQSQSDTNTTLSKSSKERRVPVYKISRMASYGGIVVKILLDSLKGQKLGKLSKKTVDDIVGVLCKLRGVSLKLGQFLSIQGTRSQSK